MWKNSPIECVEKICEQKKRYRKQNNPMRKKDNINAKVGPTRWLRGVRCLLQSLNYLSSSPTTHMMGRGNHLLSGCPLISKIFPENAPQTYISLIYLIEGIKGDWKDIRETVKISCITIMGIKQREKFHSKCMEKILTQTRKLSKK